MRAYEMRVGDWSSDVCSSVHFEAWNATLPGGPIAPAAITIVDSVGFCLTAAIDGAGITLAGLEIAADDLQARRLRILFEHRQLGRASRRERVCQFVWNRVAVGSLLNTLTIFILIHNTV